MTQNILCERTQELKKVQKVALNLLKVLISVCKNNNLQYYLIYGSLLGAIRHQGFIPWDDDIDIAMPRKDYNWLKEHATEVFPTFCFFQTPENDKKCFSGGYAKLRNSKTTRIEDYNWGHQCNLGIGIDIMPLDNWNQDMTLRKRQWKRIQFIQKLLFAQIYDADCLKYRNISKSEWMKFYKLSKKFTHQKLCALLDDAFQQVDDKNATSYVVLARYFENFDSIRSFNREENQEGVLVKFEDIECSIPKNYEEYIKKSFNGNYRKYPLIGLRKPKHNALYSTDISYQEYFNKFITNNSNINVDKVIFFGDLKCVCNYVGKEKVNIQIIQSKKVPLEDIINKLNDLVSTNKYLQYMLIICSEDFRWEEKLLRNNGIYNYYILNKNPFSVINKREYIGGFSKFEYDVEKGGLRLTGWCLPKLRKVEIWNGDLIIGNAQIGIKREDVLKNYPEYGEGYSGWEFEHKIIRQCTCIYIKYVFCNGNEYIVKSNLQ